MTGETGQNHIHFDISHWPNGQEILTPHPPEATMPNEIIWNDEFHYYYPQPHRYQGSPAIQHHTALGDFVQDKNFLDQLMGLTKPKTPEQKFRELDIRVGDRVRLTVKASPDAGQLEGEVIGLKTRDRGSQIRIKGFDHTGGAKVRGVASGGQHVWFPVADYTIEVLHKAYRWTDYDELLVTIAGFGRKYWEGLTEQRRKDHRSNYDSRVSRVKKILEASK